MQKGVKFTTLNFFNKKVIFCTKVTVQAPTQGLMGTPEVLEVR
jgi:hypothetical protein